MLRIQAPGEGFPPSHPRREHHGPVQDSHRQLIIVEHFSFHSCQRCVQKETLCRSARFESRQKREQATPAWVLEQPSRCSFPPFWRKGAPRFASRVPYKQNLGVREAEVLGHRQKLFLGWLWAPTASL